mmetsp:Transcript_41823/g.101662  ORF Transcript_41823/g.101662 Transcript_41823/m.101662 type:complete len:97 (-) Transcript_41823:2142-2432(-)
MRVNYFGATRYALLASIFGSRPQSPPLITVSVVAVGYMSSNLMTAPQCSAHIMIFKSGCHRFRPALLVGVRAFLRLSVSAGLFVGPCCALPVDQKA